MGVRLPDHACGPPALPVPEGHQDPMVGSGIFCHLPVPYGSARFSVFSPVGGELFKGQFVAQGKSFPQRIRAGRACAADDLYLV